MTDFQNLLCLGVVPRARPYGDLTEPYGTHAMKRQNCKSLRKPYGILRNSSDCFFANSETLRKPYGTMMNH